MSRPIEPELQHYLGSFLLQTAMMAAMTLIPFFCFQHLGGGERSAALAYGVQTLSLGITCFVSAPFVSHWRNGLLGCFVGAAGFGAFYFLASFAESVIAFCVLTGISMCFFALAWPALQSWLGAQPNEQKRTTSFSRFNIAIGLGLTAGPLVEGGLDQLNFRAAFLGVLLLSLAAAALLFILPQEKAYFSSHAVPDSSAPSHPVSAANCRASEIFLYCGWVMNMVGWGLTGAVRTVYAGQLARLVHRGQLVLLSLSLPVHVFTATGGPAAATLYSWLQTVLSLGYFGAILLMGRTTRWQHKIGLIVAAQTALAAGIWVLAGSQSLLLIFACHATMGAYTGFAYMSSQCYSTANPARKHTRIAINEGLSQSSGFILPLAFAQLGAWYGLSRPFQYAPLLLAGVIIFELISLRYAKRRINSSIPLEA